MVDFFSKFTDNLELEKQNQNIFLQFCQGWGNVYLRLHVLY